ncbi:DNA mismatch repair protein MutS [Desulfosarcina alkanivorans]|uniref:DNA mismatch repair protein MutS n=2 Tax=Desulfosarcina alkanivorans TaxID=571177 RepID=A0A5K7YK53_9BACT|nr:DNA mismatch repair protein MutS [Desulfosarcina alkanivorans]BBO67161.1 DNA mismatch repair protein MutS [Desulfosarcina alkanivorans]
MAPVKATPMMQQYLSIKERYPDVLLFYRMGDFFEMFFEDARLASRELEITLTSRNKNDDAPIPMCGVPYRAAQGYIARLIEKGYKVAICDQVEDPRAAKGLVKREVVRVVTPGMIIEDELLDEKANNFILAVSRHQQTTGLASLDISTGSFRLTETADVAAIIDEIRRVAPREILIPESLKADGAFASFFDAAPDYAVTVMQDRSFEYAGSRQRLLEQFDTLSLEGFGCASMKAGVGAAGALIHYVSETQRQKIEHLSAVQTYFLGKFLVVDDQSCRNLELSGNIRTGSRHGTLLGILDQTVTAMGGRLLAHWLRYPLLEPEAIQSRFDAVAEAGEQMQARRDLRERLKPVRDLERLGGKLSMGHGNARDLTALKGSIQALAGIFDTLSRFSVPLYAYDGDTAALDELAGLIDRAIREDAPPTITEGGMIRTGYDQELDELIRISRDGKGWLAELEAKERDATGINSLKVRFNKVFGYYIEVPRAHSQRVPDHYVRKQTLVNAERYITDDLKHFESRVLGAEDQRAAMEQDIFMALRDQVKAHHGGIQAIARFVARVDCLTTFAEVAQNNGYHRPDINTDGVIDIHDGRHPVVEQLITGERFVPNSIVMDNRENQVLIITGPNMAGKSTVLRQVALMTIMAQMGSFVPAQQANIGITDRIFTRVGALDNLSAGQSTFMVEMQETANIVNNATADSLVILDEIGRGTSTYDGLSIAWAVAEYLHGLNGTGTRTLFATHYHELTDLENQLDRVKNYNIAVKEWNDEIIFLRKLVKGGTNRSYGIQVARLAGIPEPVIRRSKKILARIEAGKHLAAGEKDEAGAGSGKKDGHVQLGLFSPAERKLVEAIQMLDVSRMTPLEALNTLNELQIKSQSVVY